MKYLKKITLITLTFIVAFLMIFKDINLKADNETYNLLTYRDTSINLQAGPGNGAFIRFQINHLLEVDQIVIKNLDKIDIDKTTIVSGLSSNFTINDNETTLNTYTNIPNEIVVSMSESFESLVFMILPFEGVNKQLYSEYFMETIKIYGKLNGNNVPKKLHQLETVFIEENYETIGDYAVQKVILNEEKNYSFEFNNSYDNQISFNGATYQDLPNGNINFNAYYNYYSYSYDIFVTDLEPIFNVSDGFEITFRYFNNFEEIEIYSFSSLPLTAGNFDNGLNGVGDVFITKYNESSYGIRMIYLQKHYLLTVDTLPEFLIKSSKVYYFSDKGQRFLAGFYDNEVMWTATSELHTNLMENSYIVWNVTTGEYMNSEINFVPARLGDKKHKWTDARRLYADIIIPHNIDDLLAISVNYKYQYHYLNGSKGAWTTVNDQVLLKDETSPGQPSWWTAFIMIPYKNIAHQYPVDEIKEITITNAYKLDYLTWLNEAIAEEAENYSNIENRTYSESEVFPMGAKAYSLYLGTFNKFWSVGVGAKEFTVLQYRYIYKGVEYSNPYPKTLAPEYTPPDRSAKPPDWFTKLLNDIWEFILQYSWVAIPIIGLSTVGFIYKGIELVNGKKLRKNRLIILIAWIGILMTLWYFLINK